MKKGIVPALRAKGKDLCGTSHLFEAHLMSPNEVAKGSQAFSTKLQRALDGKWLLSGAVCDKVFPAMKMRKPSDTAISIDVLSVSSGATYGIVRCDFGDFQHLFLLPLYLKKVNEFFAAAAIGPSHFQFICEANDDGLIFNCPTVPRQFMSFLELNNVAEYQSRSDLLRELIDVVSTMPELTRSSLTRKWRNLQTFDVSILVPYEYIDALDELGAELSS